MSSDCITWKTSCKLHTHVMSGHSVMSGTREKYELI